MVYSSGTSLISGVYARSEIISRCYRVQRSSVAGNRDWNNWNGWWEYTSTVVVQQLLQRPRYTESDCVAANPARPASSSATTVRAQALDESQQTETRK